MLNHPSPMMTRNEMGFTNNAKKLPNPAYFKIVKCKNFERGMFIYHSFKHYFNNEFFYVFT